MLYDTIVEGKKCRWYSILFHLRVTVMVVSSLLSEKVPVVKSVVRRPQLMLTYVIVTDCSKDAPSSFGGEGSGGELG